MSKTIFITLILAIMINPAYSNRKEKTKKKVLTRFERWTKWNNKNTGILLVHSDSLNIHWKTAVNKNPKTTIHPDQPMHFASIGKTFTSTLISILYEKGMINFNDPINSYLDGEIIDQLHIYKEADYSNKILIRHLLNHTSGLPDYYSDKNKAKIRGIDLMISNPEHFWSPTETIIWSKENLKPKFPPGEGFHYSDTNYQLLGLIIEKITGLALHEAYLQFIFEPLGMKNSSLALHAQPMEETILPMTDIYYKKLNLANAKSISMSWASGGVVSTTEDMLLFIKALNNNVLIKEETFGKMKDWAKMASSIRYGYGLMNFKFKGMPETYTIWGNSGSTGAIMYYCPAFDTYVIGSFNKLNYQVPPILFIVFTLRDIKKHIS
jgi:D-alanyl-D-alanine carboxypeptidase